MVKDSLKNRVRFSSTLSPEVDKALKEYSQNTMIPISKILDSAIMEYISKKITNDIWCATNCSSMYGTNHIASLPTMS